MSPNRTIEIDGVVLHLANPLRDAPEWVGQREVLLQLLAGYDKREIARNYIW